MTDAYNDLVRSLQLDNKLIPPLKELLEEARQARRHKWSAAGDAEISSSALAASLPQTGGRRMDHIP